MDTTSQEESEYSWTKQTTKTLVDLQLDAQYSYLFTYNTFIKILYMFRALPCSSSGGLRRNCIYQRLHVYNYDVDLLKMNRVLKKRGEQV